MTEFQKELLSGNVKFDFAEFKERLEKIRDEKLTHESNCASGNWSYDRGIETMFYEAQALILKMDTERIRGEVH